MLEPQRRQGRKEDLKGNTFGRCAPEIFKSYYPQMNAD
jgi:hypothetical protein